MHQFFFSNNEVINFLISPNQLELARQIHDSDQKLNYLNIIIFLKQFLFNYMLIKI
jgi:hypothetical protein